MFISKLSRREKEIVQLISEGLSSRDIANRLHISQYTVTTHRRNILAKLGIRKTTHLLKIFLVEQSVTNSVYSQ